ncbi:MAG: GNAT family N-acetyltransferase [Solirubrobacterales bacterium]
MLVGIVAGGRRRVRAAIEPCPPPAELAPIWRDLESRARQPPFFLSWDWLGAVVAALGRPHALIKARLDDRVIGLALLGRRRGPLLDLLHTPSLHLNETGDPTRDAVMIEYNGILAERGLEAEATSACLDALADSDGWREIHLSGVPPSVLNACRRTGLEVRLRRTHRAPFADFNAMPAGDPLEALSRNSRQQIRRAIRLYEERGPLTVDRAATPEQATDWLDRLERFHTPYWQARGQPGAFANPHFRKLHRVLIESGFPACDLMRVRAGEADIGYLYNFRKAGWAYSYQSGFHYEEDERLKPGLVSHVLAMRLYRDMGLDGYRLLAGDSRYKNSLASGSDELLWAVAHRRDLGHCLEGLARRLLGRRA